MLLKIYALVCESVVFVFRDPTELALEVIPVAVCLLEAHGPSLLPTVEGMCVSK